jgi:prepilin-type N-terminal cleavage/methylation domain-containing protein
MRNERGLTLIELLATLTISSVILGVSFMLFTSANGLFSNSVQKSKDTVSKNTAINAISKELSDSVKLYLYSANELRFQTLDNRSMALKYDKTNKKLTLEQSTVAGQDIASLTFATSPLKTLATNLSVNGANSTQAFAVYRRDNSTALPVGTIIPDDLLIKDRLIYIWLFFEAATIKPNGTRVPTYEKVILNIALFQ